MPFETAALDGVERGAELQAARWVVRDEFTPWSPAAERGPGCGLA